MAEGYTVKNVDDLEVMEGSGGATWRLARKTLGAEGFGFNVVDIEPGGQIPEHDETGDRPGGGLLRARGGGGPLSPTTRSASGARRHLHPLRP